MLLKPDHIVEWDRTNPGYPVYVYILGPLTVFVKDFDKTRHPRNVYEIGFYFGTETSTDWENWERGAYWHSAHYSIIDIPIVRPRLVVEHWLQTNLLAAVHNSIHESKEDRRIHSQDDKFSLGISGYKEWVKFGPLRLGFGKTGHQVQILIRGTGESSPSRREFPSTYEAQFYSRYGHEGDFERACEAFLLEVGSALYERTTED